MEWKLRRKAKQKEKERNKERTEECIANKGWKHKEIVAMLQKES